MATERQSKLGRFVDTLFYYRQKPVNWNFVADSGMIDIVLPETTISDNVNSEIASVSIEQVDGITLDARKFVEILEGTSDLKFINTIVISISEEKYGPHTDLTLVEVEFNNLILRNNYKVSQLYSEILGQSTNKFSFKAEFTRAIDSFSSLALEKQDQSEIKVFYYKIPNCSKSMLSVAPLPTTMNYLFRDPVITEQSNKYHNVVDGLLFLERSLFYFILPPTDEDIEVELGSTFSSNGVCNEIGLSNSYKLQRVGPFNEPFNITIESDQFNSYTELNALSLLQSTTQV